MSEPPFIYEITALNPEHPSVRSGKNPRLKIGGLSASRFYNGEEHIVETSVNGIPTYLCTTKLVGRYHLGEETNAEGLPDLKLMRLYAQLATQGPWVVEEGDDYDRPKVISHHGIPPEERHYKYRNIPGDRAGNDARYIALANPRAMLAILNHIERLEGQVAQLTLKAGA